LHPYAKWIARSWQTVLEYIIGIVYHVYAGSLGYICRISIVGRSNMDGLTIHTLGKCALIILIVCFIGGALIILDPLSKILDGDE
jgi:hypothetical protein